MKNLLIIATILASVSYSCSKKDGGSAAGKGGKETKITPDIITKDNNQKFVPKTPFGMVPIPKGSFQMGQSDQDFASTQDAKLKTVTVSEFFMDETEITNAEYKEFVKYVRDSVVRYMLGEKVEMMGGEPSEEGVGQYAFKKAYVKADGEELTPYEEYLKDTEGDVSVNDPERKKINWSVPLIWDTKDYPDVDYTEVLESLYYTPEERYNGKRQLDYRKFMYSYDWLDFEAVRSNKNRNTILKKESVLVYPDTTAWVKDFAFAYNDPMHDEYFWHIAYNSYPVVGVSWEQATAFSDYRTRRYFSKNKAKNLRYTEFRLPTEAEWEYAAKGGLANAPYPWGGPYLMEGGCFLANFKPKRGDYVEDPKTGNYIYTAKVKTFKPNGYGLYDMAGNVAEWTQTPYYSSTYSVVPSSNPYVGRSGKNPMKVVRGGSWKDVSYQLMVSSRDYEHKDTARSYIGFRCVQAIPEGVTVKTSRVNQ